MLSAEESKRACSLGMVVSPADTVPEDTQGSKDTQGGEQVKRLSVMPCA